LICAERVYKEVEEYLDLINKEKTAKKKKFQQVLIRIDDVF